MQLDCTCKVDVRPSLRVAQQLTTLQTTALTSLASTFPTQENGNYSTKSRNSLDTRRGQDGWQLELGNVGEERAGQYQIQMPQLPHAPVQPSAAAVHTNAHSCEGQVKDSTHRFSKLWFLRKVMILEVSSRGSCSATWFGDMFRSSCSRRVAKAHAARVTAK
ncbi:hypothetical protein E2C01_012087 [Portunus trituberculatus]|uniref:Uncharacterized protein n=1 Tax=Portunus trituberculatus TaxID=210409 RepID=A0A5B7DD74_PORTR|nr:hypothetical protein [Portunus trituberculatus]